MAKSSTATPKTASKKRERKINVTVTEAGEDKDDKTSEVETDSPAPEEANEVGGLPEKVEPTEPEEVLMNSDAKEDGNEDGGMLKEADNDSGEEDKDVVRDGHIVQEHQEDTTPDPAITAENVTVTWKSDSAMDVDEKVVETPVENTEVDLIDEQHGNVTPEKRKAGSTVKTSPSKKKKKKKRKAESTVETSPSKKEKKRKAESTVETSPSKKMKESINDGFRVFVGNLNRLKNGSEIKDSLTDLFKTHSLVIKDITLDRSRRFGYIYFSTEEDLKKALELNGEKILDNPLKLEKPKPKEANDQDAKDARTLLVKNLPLSATKKELKNLFGRAVDIRFPFGFDCSSTGVAFIEFKTEVIAEKEQKAKQGTVVKDKAIIINFLRRTIKKKLKKDAAANITPNSTLVVCNLSCSANERALKKVFVKAVRIRRPKPKDKRAYAFIEFESVDDAKNAMEKSQNKNIKGREIRIEYSRVGQRKEISKTLFVSGLAKETSAETLQSAFEGAVAARVCTDKNTVSKGFGFIDFESQEKCKAVKETMEDCVIDGRTVFLGYAISNDKQGCSGEGEGIKSQP